LRSKRGTAFYVVENMLWSFRKTGTAETLASQAKIGVCVQALGGGATAWIRGGITPGNFLRMYMQNPAI